MKRPIVMSFVAVGLGAALAIGVPGISPEQQAQAFAPCTNSVTCQPANVPMLVEAGMIKIGQDGLIKTAATVPKSPATSPWAGLNWVGNVVRDAASNVAKWSIKMGVELLYDGEKSVRGEVDAAMTTEGLPEATVEVDADYQFPQPQVDQEKSSACSSRYWPDQITSLGSIPQATCTSPINARTRTGVEDAVRTPVYFDSFKVVRDGLMQVVIRWPDTAQTFTSVGDVRVLFYGANGALNSSSRVKVLRGTNNLSLSYSAGPTLGGPPVAVIFEPTYHQQTYLNREYLMWSVAGTTAPPIVRTQKGVMERTLDCTDPAGVVQTINNQTPGTMGQGLLTLAPLRCPPGTLPTDTGTIWKPETGEPFTILPKTNAPPPAIKEMQKYPDCWDGKCLVTLERSDGSSCGKVGENCPDWASDPNRQQNYVCKYGGKVANLSMCSMYRAPDFGVLPNVGTDGEYLDPSAPVPGNIGKTVTKPGSSAPLSDLPANQPQKDCRPSSFFQMLNPFYVFQAVQCAITETFVPGQDKVTSITLRMSKAMEGTTPALIAAEISDLEFKTPASSCSGVTLDLRWLGAGYRQVMDACPGSPLAPLVWWSRLLGNIGFSLWGLVAVTRHVAHVFNFRGLGD